MSKRNFMIALFVPLACMGAHVASAAEHFGKRISLVEVSTAACYFFQLEGVAQADPAVPSSAWFAIPIGQTNAKEMYALLVAVRTSGLTLNRVLTTGGVVCGAAGVQTLDF